MIKTIDPFTLSFLIIIIVAIVICERKDDKKIKYRLTVIEKKLGIDPQ